MVSFIRFVRPSDGRQLTNARRVSKVLSFVPVAWYFPSFSSTRCRLLRCVLVLVTVTVDDGEELGGVHCTSRSLPGHWQACWDGLRRVTYRCREMPCR